MRFRFQTLLVLPLLLGFDASVRADIYNYNLISFGDVNAVGGNSFEVEGTSYIGGSLFGSSQNFGIGTAGTTALQVVGEINGASQFRSINNGNDAEVGGNNNAGINMNGGGTYRYDSVSLQGTVNGTAIPVAGLRNDLIMLGSDLLNDAQGKQLIAAGISPNSANPLIMLNGNPVFTAQPSGPNNLASFSIDGDALFETNLGSISLDRNGADTIIFNVSGSDIDLGAGGGNFVGDFNPSSAASILWNFYEADTIAINRQWFGAILAPEANLVATSGAIDGTVVVKSLESNVEIHLPNFTSTIPEPTSAPILALAIAAHAIRRRRTNGRTTR